MREVAQKSFNFFLIFASDLRLFDSQSDLEFSFSYAISKQVLVVYMNFNLTVNVFLLS